MTKSRTLDSKAVKAIMSKRSLVLQSQVGKRVVLTVQGEGSVIEVKDKSGNFVRSVTNDGTVFQKKIVNFRASSQLAMSSGRNRQLLMEGIRTEKAGDVQKADELFTKFLNATQLTMGIPLPSHKADQCVSGAEVAGRVTLIETEEGQLLSIDPSSISIVEPERLSTTIFQLPGEEEEESDELAPASELSAMDRSALKSFIAAKGLGIKVTRNMTEEDIRDAILQAMNALVPAGDEEDEV